MLVLLLAACTQEPPTETDLVAAALALQGDVPAGEAVYAASCAGCHGADGEGGTGPAMTEKVPLMTDERIAERIVAGYDSDQPSSMPAMTELGEQDIADCLAWLRATFGGA